MGILAYWVVHRISIIQEGQTANREMIGYNPGYISIAILSQFYAVSLQKSVAYHLCVLLKYLGECQTHMKVAGSISSWL